MQRYETVFILTPQLSEDQAKEAVGKFRKILKDVGAKITHEESWGIRASDVQLLKEERWAALEKKGGYYHLFEFEGRASNVSDLELSFKRDERVLRFLTVRLDKHS